MFSKKEYIDFLKNIKYPDCKIKELLIIKFNDSLNIYSSLESNQQVNTLLKIIKNINQIALRTNSFIIENRLLEILTKKDPYYDFYQDLKNKLKTFKTDDQLYDYIRKKRFYYKKINKNKDIIPRNLCDARKNSSQNLFYDLKNDLKNIETYLDIGAGDGAKTFYFGQELKLNKENIFGLDFVNFHSVDYLKKRNKNITFIDIKNPKEKYPIKNNSFDLISSFMVAHHIKDLHLYLNEINRILKKGKYFLLVEHNNFTSLDSMLADIEHSMYEIVYEKVPNYNFKKEEYTQYYDWITWSMIIEKYNFKLIRQGEIKSTVTSSLMPTSTCYMLFKKI